MLFCIIWRNDKAAEAVGQGQGRRLFGKLVVVDFGRVRSASGLAASGSSLRTDIGWVMGWVCGLTSSRSDVSRGEGGMTEWHQRCESVFHRNESSVSLQVSIK